MWTECSIDLGAERSLQLAQAGRGPDLVLIHGALATHHDWRAGPAEALVPLGRVTLVDRPGHGRSRRPRFFGTPRDQARQIADGLAAVGIGSAILVGHSFGGLVALALAEQRPELVRALVLVAPLVFPEPRLIEHSLLAPRAMPLIGPWLSRAAEGLGFDRPLIEAAQQQMFAPDAVPERWKASFPWEEVLDPEALVREGEDAAAILPMSPAGMVDLSAIDAPVHIVTGGSDRIVAHAVQGEALSRLLRDARLTGIEGAGHMLHHSHTERLAGIVGALIPTGAS